MEAHAEFRVRSERSTSTNTGAGRREMRRSSVVLGIGPGVLGGIALASPLVIWDWVRSSHIALEFPTAVTAWLFGLDHFSHTDYRLGPILIGTAFIALYCAASGVAYAAIAESRPRRMSPSVLGGFAWGFVNFIFVWYMVLPIARGGAPLRSPSSAPGLFVAPNWVWILGFTLFGVVTGVASRAIRTGPATMDDSKAENPEPVGAQGEGT
jgi:hypothetical protein